MIKELILYICVRKINERGNTIMSDVYMLFGISFGIQLLFVIIMVIAAIKTPITKRDDLTE